MNTISTADLYDEFAKQLCILDPIFSDYGGNKHFYGEVVTVRCFEDNSRVKELLNSPGAGRVLVVDGAGSLRRALLGDLIAAAAVKNGWSGVVINGCIRDSDAIGQMALGVRALATTPAKTERKGIGDVGVDVCFAGQTITEGQWIYCDADGMVLASTNVVA